MKRRLLILLLLVAMCACKEQGLTESEVMEIVVTGQAQGKNYIITKLENGRFDVQEVEDFPAR